MENAWTRGAAAGLLAGVPWALVLSAGALLAGARASEPFAALASAVPRLPAGAGGTLGLLLHLAVSAALGATWVGLAGRYLRPTASAAGGVAAGLVAWMLGTWLLLPVFAPALRLLSEEMRVAWLAAHVAWGLTLGLASDALEPPELLRAVPPFARWLHARRRRARQ
ncbi:MAG: hypothetical protein RL653_3732 [Pseudomonadota bacterium]